MYGWGVNWFMGCHERLYLCYKTRRAREHVGMKSGASPRHRARKRQERIARLEAHNNVIIFSAYFTACMRLRFPTFSTRAARVKDMRNITSVHNALRL